MLDLPLGRDEKPSTFGYGDTRKALDLKWNNVNDILEMELDLNLKTLILIVNGGDPVIACDNVKEGRYRLILGTNMGIKEQFELL